MSTEHIRRFVATAGSALALFAASANQLHAQPDQSLDNTVRLTVTLDRPDWRYRIGDSATFTVSLAHAGRDVPGARVIVQLGPERMRAMRSDTVAVSARGVTRRGALSVPGFLRATARVTIEGAEYSAMATAAFEPERIDASIAMPPDFETFWATAIAYARQVPLLPVMTRLPEQSTPDVDVYHVSFQNHRAGSRLYGMLSVPTKPGKYPAMLVVPGAGVRPYFPSITTARRGVIHLTIGIHGIPVDRDLLLYNELRATALAGYPSSGAEDRDAYYYKRVIVGLLRAGDFLHGLPQFDGRNYAVQGGSQGGGLAIIAGALDPRVKAIAASYPAMADQLGYFRGRAGGWPHMFADTLHVKAKAEKVDAIRYYDVVNFARLLKVPGVYAWGFNDEVVPPTSMYAAYNLITAPKETHIVVETGHFRVRSQIDAMDAWLLKALGVQ